MGLAVSRRRCAAAVSCTRIRLRRTIPKSARTCSNEFAGMAGTAFGGRAPRTGDSHIRASSRRRGRTRTSRYRRPTLARMQRRRPRAASSSSRRSRARRASSRSGCTDAVRTRAASARAVAQEIAVCGAGGAQIRTACRARHGPAAARAHDERGAWWANTVVAWRGVDVRAPV
jgi:hypothetical protein